MCLGLKLKIKKKLVLCLKPSYDLRNVSSVWHVCKSLPSLGQKHQVCGVLSALETTCPNYEVRCLKSNYSELDLEKSWDGVEEIKTIITIIFRRTLSYVYFSPAG